MHFGIFPRQTMRRKDQQNLRPINHDRFRRLEYNSTAKGSIYRKQINLDYIGKAKQIYIF